MKVGILALQGAFIEHYHVMQRLGHDSVLVKTVQDLEGIDCLILPGGESTTMALLAESLGLLEPLRKLIIQNKLPTFGTCAGMILLCETATNVKQDGQRSIGGLQISIERNAFGRQSNSFVTDLVIPEIGMEEPFMGIFIRAPAIQEIPSNSHVTVFARLPSNLGSHIVGVYTDSILAIAFHPELALDNRIHEYFVQKFVLKST